MNKPKIIAFYLPQYHPTPDNDKWWGKGFTEWTNVGKAKPLFPGHYQPKVPADLGYYDLRLPEARKAQADLAKEAGIYGFCYYHYWFGNGKMELERPFQEVLTSGAPDFPFMLCWANESWHKKFWNKDGKGSSKEILIEQTYPDEQDIINHFYHVLPAFKDERYIKVENKPVFMIYKPFLHPSMKKFIEIWRELAHKESLGGIYFIGQLQEEFTTERYDILINTGFDAINTVGLYEALNRNLTTWNSVLRRLSFHLFNLPLICDYGKCMRDILTQLDTLPNVFPSIIPNWDHTPRSGKAGWVLKDSSPEKFKEHVESILNFLAENKKRICFLKSWNEWGEGNYMEPDLKYGKSFIHELAMIVNKDLKD